MDNDSQTELEGQLERITYFSEETGFTVARLKIRGSALIAGIRIIVLKKTTR